MAIETIQTDVDTGSSDSQQEFSAEDAFFRNITDDGESPSGDGTASKTKQTNEEPDTDDSEQEDQEDPDSTPATPKEVARRAAEDADEVTVKVGDEEHRVSVKDLKRLFGQEQALTRKSQEAAEARTRVDAEASRYAAGLGKMSGEAKARWAEYEKVDYLAARDSMSPEAYTQLRQDATQAYQDYKFYGEELNNFVAQQQSEAAASHRNRAKDCLATLQRPSTDDHPNPSHIEGWSESVYNDIREFAMGLGADRATINGLVDPVSIKIMHMAMKYQAAERTARTLKPSAKVPTSPTRVPGNRERGETEEAPTGSTSANARKAFRTLQGSGHIDDAADVFFQRLHTPK